MRILEIVSGAEINGAVVHCALLSRELTKRGHTVTLLCRKNAKIKRLLTDDSIECIESDMHRWPLDELRRIGNLARERRIEILHTHMTRAHNFGLFLRRFAHVPCVATAHSHIVQPLTFMFNDHVIAVSEATRHFQQRRNLVPSHRIETVYGFMDYERHAGVMDEARCSIRRELDIADHTPVIGIIGDIIPRKGHLYLIRALPAILEAVPAARLLVVGDPKRSMGQKYFERLKSEVTRLGLEGKVLWAGYRTDIPQVMRVLDVYVLASLDEMFPVAALEAMAAARPIVATAVGGVPECFKTGDSALLVPPADSAALAAAICTYLQNRPLAQRFAERARTVAREQFSLQSQAPRIEGVFERVLHRYAQYSGKSSYSP